MIHETAIIEAGAEISPEADIQAYCYVGGNVKLGAVKLASHARVEGRTTIGDGSFVASFACVGGDPQIQNFDPTSAGELIIGKNTVIREYVTINTGSPLGVGKTTVGDNCILMISCHIAHDCQIGDNVIMANNSAMAGHVEIGNYAVLGANCHLHQRVRVGQYSMIGGCSVVENDVIPYGLVKPQERDGLEHLNWRRIKNMGIKADEQKALMHFFKELFKSEGALLPKAESMLEKYKDSEIIQNILHFVLSDSDRHIATPKNSKKS